MGKTDETTVNKIKILKIEEEKLYLEIYYTSLSYCHSCEGRNSPGPVNEEIIRSINLKNYIHDDDNILFNTCSEGRIRYIEDCNICFTIGQLTDAILNDVIPQEQIKEEIKEKIKNEENKKLESLMEIQRLKFAL